jgi:hypothetical protein
VVVSSGPWSSAEGQALAEGLFQQLCGQAAPIWIPPIVRGAGPDRDGGGFTPAWGSSGSTAALPTQLQKRYTPRPCRPPKRPLAAIHPPRAA